MGALAFVVSYSPQETSSQEKSNLQDPAHPEAERFTQEAHGRKQRNQPLEGRAEAQAERGHRVSAQVTEGQHAGQAFLPSSKLSCVL